MFKRKTLFLIRGTSGSGKSTLATNLADLFEKSDWNCYSVFEADSYFSNYNPITQDFTYVFDPTKLHLAHKECQENCERAMGWGDTIIVSNTSTTEKELKPYLDLAEKYGYDIVSLVLERRHSGVNVHSVPPETVEKQEKKLRGSLKLS